MEQHKNIGAEVYSLSPRLIEIFYGDIILEWSATTALFLAFNNFLMYCAVVYVSSVLTLTIAEISWYYIAHTRVRALLFVAVSMKVVTSEQIVTLQDVGLQSENTISHWALDMVRTLQPCSQ